MTDTEDLLGAAQWQELAARLVPPLRGLYSPTPFKIRPLPASDSAAWHTWQELQAEYLEPARHIFDPDALSAYILDVLPRYRVSILELLQILNSTGAPASTAEDTEIAILEAVQGTAYEDYWWSTFGDSSRWLLRASMIMSELDGMARLDEPGIYSLNPRLYYTVVLWGWLWGADFLRYTLCDRGEESALPPASIGAFLRQITLHLLRELYQVRGEASGLSPAVVQERWERDLSRWRDGHLPPSPEDRPSSLPVAHDAIRCALESPLLREE